MLFPSLERGVGTKGLTSACRLVFGTNASSMLLAVPGVFLNPWRTVSTNLYVYPALPTRTLLLLPILPMPYLVSTCWSQALQNSLLTELVLISLGMLAAEYCVKWIFFLLTVSLSTIGNANAAVFPTEGFLSPGPSWRGTLCWLHSSGMKFLLFYIYCLHLIEGKRWL